jgi:broad specificity phosphatase PhoE
VVVQIVYETHATTVDNENGIATGWLPGELSATGHANAEELGRRHRDDGFDVVLTSDLARAVQTVEIAFAGVDVPIITDSRLRELDFGD